MHALRSGAILGILCALLAPAAHAAIGVEARVDVEADVHTTSLPPLEMPSTEVDGPAVSTSADRAALGRALSVDLEATARANVDGAAQGRANYAQQAAAMVPEPVREAAPGVLATVGAVAVAQAFGAFRFALVGAFALYSRLSRSELLDNEHRDKVYKLVQAQPGIAMTEIGTSLGLGWGTVVYHLDRLERAGFVATERSGMRRCCFPVGLVPREARASLGALQADTTRALATYLAAHPGATQSEVCEAIGLSASAASKQVSKLEAAGLVRREREWKTVHLWPEPKLGAMLSPTPPAATTSPLNLQPFAPATA